MGCGTTFGQHFRLSWTSLSLIQSVNIDWQVVYEEKRDAKNWHVDSVFIGVECVLAGAGAA